MNDSSTLFTTQDLVDTPPAYWFAMAKWAKETEQYNPFVRRFLFNVGTIKSSGKELSEKQSAWALRVMNESRDKGYVFVAEPK